MPRRDYTMAHVRFMGDLTLSGIGRRCDTLAIYATALVDDLAASS